MSLLEVWKYLLHARQHIIKTAPTEAIQILWEAEGAVIQEREPDYRFSRANQGAQRDQDLEQTEQSHAVPC